VRIDGGGPAEALRFQQEAQSEARLAPLQFVRVRGQNGGPCPIPPAAVDDVVAPIYRYAAGIGTYQWAVPGSNQRLLLKGTKGFCGNL
jgi:hypothetical protein